LFLVTPPPAPPPPHASTLTQVTFGGKVNEPVEVNIAGLVSEVT